VNTISEGPLDRTMEKIALRFFKLIVGLVIVFITILMGEKIGIGTLLNMLLIGFFLDLLLAIRLIPRIDNTALGIVVIIFGLYVISLGSYFYIGSGFGAGPRDSLMVALTRRQIILKGAVVPIQTMLYTPWLRKHPWKKISYSPFY